MMAHRDSHRDGEAEADQEGFSPSASNASQKVWLPDRSSIAPQVADSEGSDRPNPSGDKLPERRPEKMSDQNREDRISRAPRGGWNHLGPLTLLSLCLNYPTKCFRLAQILSTSFDVGGSLRIAVRCRRCGSKLRTDQP